MPSLSRVGFAWPRSEQVLFEDVNLLLPVGWTALLGPNGAGKSTLLDVIEGVRAPDSGRVDGVGFVVRCSQEAPAQSDEVGAFAYVGDRSSRRLMDQLGLDPEALERWSTLSPGEQKRWQVGSALYQEPDVLLLDEPSNHLDAEGRAWLHRALVRFRGAGVLVAHDLPLLDALCTRTAWLEQGRLQAWALAPSEALAARDQERAEALGRLTSQQEAVRAAERRLQQTRQQHAASVVQLSARRRMKGPKDHDARSTAAKARAQSGERSRSRAVGRVRELVDRRRLELGQLDVHTELGRSLFVDYEAPARRVLLCLAGETLQAGPRTLVHDVSVQLERGQKVHLCGPNGSGKSTLLHRLVQDGSLPKDKGLWLPQELDPEVVRAWQAHVLDLPNQERARVLHVLAALGVDPLQVVHSPDPSPGQARKLGLAMGLGTQVWWVALDEPENHLDLPSRRRLKACLQAFPGAVVLVSHDASLVQDLCGIRWRLGAGRLEAEPIQGS